MDLHFQRPPGSAETAAGSPGDPEPELRERRILVLHNRDFEPDGVTDDPDVISRADVESSARDVARALVSRGHFVEVKGIDSDDLGDLLRQLKADPPDLVFNLIESLGADARHEVLVPSLLELLGVPYTGSAPLTLGLCGRKQHTKQILRGAGIITPPAALLPAQSAAADREAVAGLGYPLFVKLAHEDASVGISASSIVNSDEELVRQVEALRARYRQPILVEKFIPGRELYVGLLGSSPVRTLPVQELDFSALPAGLPHIVSYQAKWDRSSVEYKSLGASQLAGPMPEAVLRRVEAVAAQCFQVLELCDYGRCDIRLANDGTPYVIDVNPNCDLADGAGYSRAGLLVGLSYDLLIEQIAISALKRNSHALARRNGQKSHLDPA